MTPPAQLDVISTGPLVLVQDLGRPGWAHLGVSDSGAADRAAFRRGAALVGNDVGRAGLEVVLGGLAVRAIGGVRVAVTGADVPLRHQRAADRSTQRPSCDTALQLADGDVLRLGTPRSGLRSYLSVSGGIDVPAVLGSRSTDTLSGLGPAPVRPGDRLPVGSAPGESVFADSVGTGAVSRGSVPNSAVPHLPVASDPAPADNAQALDATEALTLPVIPGPRSDYLADPGLLVRAAWTVSPHSDRIGLRLLHPGGEKFARATGFADRELPSEPMLRGAIQVPPSGEPVILFADHPTTGGYPVIGVVADAGLDALAQLRPGAAVQFRWSPGATAPSAGGPDVG